ncbi:MAG: ABC transporter permease [Acidimicrobiia bacterium]|nr:ABC transporter permease [Acidimicrobiia bacterium]
MTELVEFTVLGLVLASVYAVAASGLVVTYTTSGIFNFAHGAIGMMSTFLFWQFTVGWDMHWALAMFIILVGIAPAFGWIVDRVIMRGLANTSEVTRIVVPIGLLFALLSLAPLIWRPTENRLVPPIFGRQLYDVLGINVTRHQLVVVAIAVVVALGLRFLLFKTRSGVAMRAVVDSRELTQLNGASPGRSSALSWALGSSLAALAGILIADQVGLEVLALTLLVINAYAAAVVGRLTSLPLTFLGAGILGLAQSYAVGFMPDTPAWLAERGIEASGALRTAIPVVMLFIVLLLVPHAPLRGGGIQRSREAAVRPDLRGSLIGFAVVIGVTVVLSGMLTEANLVAWGKGFAFALIMLSLVPLTGYGGQISLAQLSFAGIGAWAVATWGTNGSPLGLVAAIVAAAAVGAVIALPALRLRGIYLALATLAFAVFMERAVFTQQAVFGGSKPVSRPQFGPLELTSNRAFVIFMAVAFCAVGMGVVLLRRSRFGRRLQAMKDSPAACATLGMSLTTTKLMVFALSAAIAGLGGALLASLQRLASPANFDLLHALPILLLAVAGGVALVSGSLFGGFMLASFAIVPGWIPEGWEIAGFNARNSFSNLLLLLPAVLGVSLAHNPNGAAHEIGQQVRGVLARVRGATGEDEPDMVLPPRNVETLGVDRPLRDEDIAAVDTLLGLDEEVIGAAARSR